MLSPDSGPAEDSLSSRVAWAGCIANRSAFCIPREKSALSRTVTTRWSEVLHAAPKTYGCAIETCQLTGNGTRVEKAGVRPEQSCVKKGVHSPISRRQSRMHILQCKRQCRRAQTLEADGIGNKPENLWLPFISWTLDQSINQKAQTAISIHPLMTELMEQDRGPVRGL